MTTEEIFNEAVKRIGGNDMLLLYGPSHIVWEDENFSDDDIQWCLERAKDEDSWASHTEEQKEVVLWSLRELLKLPEEIRVDEGGSMQIVQHNYGRDMNLPIEASEFSLTPIADPSDPDYHEKVGRYWFDHCCSLMDENAELQKKVSDLEKERDELKQFNDWLAVELYDLWVEHTGSDISLEKHRENITKYYNMVKETNDE